MDEGGNGRGKQSDQRRSVSKQVTLGLLTNFSSFAPSMSLGFSAVALPILKDYVDTKQLSWFASIASLATPFGCFFAGPVADKFGRRTAIFIVNAVCLLGWLTLTVACYTEHDYILLMLGRILTGFSTGLCSSPATIYMAEVASSDLRGVFTTWASISFSVGVLLVYFLGFLFKADLGAICLVTAALPCIGLLLTLFFVPESPTWLVGKGRLEEAKTNMHRVFGTENSSGQVESEMETLIRNRGGEKTANNKSLARQFYSKVQYLLEPHVLKPICLVLIYFFFQQFGGTIVLVFYAIDVVKKAGITFDPYLTIVLLGFVRLFSSIFASYLSKKFGRRPLSIFSGSGMTVCLLSLATYLHLKQNGVISAWPIIPLWSFILYFVTNAIGFLPVPFALAAELFPTKIRGTAAGLISGIGYFFNFIVVKIYPDLVRHCGIKCIFYCYGSMALAGTLFVLVALPETKGKTLGEIEEYFGKPKSQILTGEKISSKA